MDCRCASPHEIHQAECRADVARGMMALTNPGGVFSGYSRQVIPPIEPPTTAAIDSTPSDLRMR